MASRGRARRPRPDQIDDLARRLLDTVSHDKVVFDHSVALDFRSTKLKPDHERRPFWVTPNGRIFLEASSAIYEAARDFLVAICEPVSRPDFVHEYRLDKNSLFAAASMGMTGDVIIASLKRMSKTPLSPQVEEFVSQCTGGYGKVKLVLKRGRYYIESAYPAVLRLLTKHPVLRKARVRTLPDGTRVIGMDTALAPGLTSDDDGFVKGEALAEDESSLGLKKLLEDGGTARQGSGGAGTGPSLPAVPMITPEQSGEVNSDEEEEGRALAKAYAAVAKPAPNSMGGATAPPAAPAKPANILDQLDDLSGAELGDLLSSIDQVLSQFEQAQSRAAAMVGAATVAGASSGGAGATTGGARAVSFKDDAELLGYDPSAAGAGAVRGSTRAGQSKVGSARSAGLMMAGGDRGKSLLDHHAKFANVATGEDPDSNVGKPPGAAHLTGEALAAYLRAQANGPGPDPSATPAAVADGAKPRLRFKIGGKKDGSSGAGSTTGSTPTVDGGAVPSKAGTVGNISASNGQRHSEQGTTDEDPSGVQREEEAPSASEQSGDFVTRSGLIYADGSKPIGGVTTVDMAGQGAGAGGAGDEDGEQYKAEQDEEYRPDEDAFAADAEALAEEYIADDFIPENEDGDVDNDDDDDGFVRRKKGAGGRGRGRGGAGAGTLARGGGRGPGGSAGMTGGVKRVSGKRPGQVKEGEGEQMVAGAYNEEEAARQALEEERQAKRARKEEVQKVGDGLDAFRAEVARLGDGLHLSTEGTVEAFEIDPLQVEAVRFVCLHLDPPFPLMQEYDHSNDTNAVPPLLDSDKKPVLLRDPSLLRDYQRKSLAKMFGNGRARSGIIVLPCGAGKTLVGISACVTVGKSCVVLCPNAMSVMQWEDQFVRFSTLARDSIIKLTSKHKSALPPRHQGCVLITTYTMMAASKRSRESEALMRDISTREWGIQLLDEVHLAVAEKYSQALRLRCHTRLGLTATLVREDAREVNLAHMIGPKLYEANWMDLTRAGYLANVQCTEVWCPMAPEFYREYCRAKGEHTRMALACCNPVKCWAMDFLLKFHEGRGDKVIIFSESIFAIQLYAAQYQGIVIAGSTPQREREAYIHAFRNTDTVNKLFLSRVGDMALDVPDANVIIQISAHYGSRLQEAQRMGRILRRGTRGNAASGNNAYFYSLVSLDTREMADATKRRRYLVDQGYAYRVLESVPGLVKSQEELCRQCSFQKTPQQRMAVLESVLRENMEELEAREVGHLDEFDVAPEIAEEGLLGDVAGEAEEDGAKGPGAKRRLDLVAAAAGGSTTSALLPPSKLSAGIGGLLSSSGGGAGNKLAALSGAEGRRYIEYQADVSGQQALAAAEQAARVEARQAARMVPKPQQG